MSLFPRVYQQRVPTFLHSSHQSAAQAVAVAGSSVLSLRAQAPGGGVVYSVLFPKGGLQEFHDTLACESTSEAEVLQADVYLSRDGSLSCGIIIFSNLCCSLLHTL
eukprot:RCo027719